MSAEPEMIDDDGPVDFDAELNDISIGEDYAPAVTPPPSNTPRVKRRVIVNEDNNTTHEIPAVGKNEKRKTKNETRNTKHETRNTKH